MISRLKLVILANWQDAGNWSFLHDLKSTVQSADIFQPISFQSLSSRLNHISKYLSEFYVPLLALIRRNRFDVVVSWQMRLGICYGLLKRMAHCNKPPVHIIQDFHIDLTKNRGLYRFNLVLLKWAIPGIDYFCCTSTEEEAIYSRMFNIPRRRIVFLPLVESMSNFEEPRRPIRDYIFSYGKSDRDFDTLIRSVTPLKLETYILSQKYNPKVPVPENVCIIRDYVSDREMVQWIASSRVVVLPLQDYRISAGQISMLEVMALARPLIITENMATKEYAVHRQTALFFGAGDAQELADHIRHLWNNPEKAEQIGQQARQAALKMSNEREPIFVNLLERCAMDLQIGKLSHEN